MTFGVGLVKTGLLWYAVAVNEYVLYQALRDIGLLFSQRVPLLLYIRERRTFVLQSITF